MYRDDTCPVCGESLPPDHLYCREHAEGVDARLHDLGAVLERLVPDLERAATLVEATHPETFDYIAEGEDDDPLWPPVPAVHVVAEADEVDVDVDAEPGKVRIDLRTDLANLLRSVGAALDDDATRRFAAACGRAEGANATH